ncbi:MAG: FtsX-like permease family protein [Phycisphaerales bacterium]|nr:FtsX-like permease family protein [Phycisphaerales bacterium]
MRFVAFRMLIGDRAKFFGILLGIAFASLLITQQASIFVGLMTRTFGFITDTALPDIWVMDPKVQFVDDIKPISSTVLLRVRGIEGVEWAMPLYKGILKARLQNGNFQQCNVIGLDDTTLIGGPPEMVEGSLADLRRADGVIVDEVGAKGRLARIPEDASGNPIPGARPEPLKIGDTLELNDRRAIVVGICRVSRTFQSQPVVYTTYSRATTFAPRERNLLSFVLVKAEPGVDHKDLCRRIMESSLGPDGSPRLLAMTRDDFAWKTVMYFVRFTGIPINFGIAVLLGFFVGTAIAGQTFYLFTVDNLRHFGALKAMGAGNARLLGMIMLQALVVGVIGYGLGVGVASLFGQLSGRTELSFRLIWQTLVITGGAVTVICILASLLSIWKVIRLEPAIVFKG